MAYFGMKPRIHVLARAAERVANFAELRELWDPTFGNALRWFRDAGLPYDRAACASLVGMPATTAT